MQLELAHANRIATIGQLSASIAHEINQPLSGIVTNCSTCLRMLTSDPLNLDGAQAVTATRNGRIGVMATPAWWVADSLLIPGAQPRATIERWGMVVRS